MNRAKLIDKQVENQIYIIVKEFFPYFVILKCLNCMNKIEHIGIAVKELSISIPIFEKILNTPCYKRETVSGEKVNTAFFQVGDSKIELLESSEEDGVIAKFIEKKGEGFHHIAFDVSNIASEVERMKNEGFVFLNETPKAGADNKLVCFLHPKSTNGMLIELCQEIVK